MSIIGTIRQRLHLIATGIIREVLARPGLKRIIRSQLAAFPRLEAWLRGYAAFTPVTPAPVVSSDMPCASFRTRLVYDQLCSRMSNTPFSERSNPPCV